MGAKRSLLGLVLACICSMVSAQGDKSLTVKDLILAIKAHHPVIASAQDRKSVV